MADLSSPESTGVAQTRDARPLAERVRAIAAPIIRALALELVEVQCAGHGTRTVIRVFVDKPGGVVVGDCEQVHLSLGHALDVEDPIPHAYTLEVSSPGLDRPLRRREDFQRSVGKLVSVKLRRPHNGQWRVVGRGRTWRRPLRWSGRRSQTRGSRWNSHRGERHDRENWHEWSM